MSGPSLFTTSVTTRRSFVGGAMAASLCGALPMAAAADADAPGLDIIGPKPGYTPQAGTLVSMLTWMRDANGVLRATEGLTQADLDYLFDKNANTIGALMLHLAATETYYGMHTFQGMKWDSWPDSVKKQWDPAMELGDAGRQTIKGHDLDFYLSNLQEVREKSLAEFKKRGDNIQVFRTPAA